MTMMKTIRDIKKGDPVYVVNGGDPIRRFVTSCGPKYITLGNGMQFSRDTGAHIKGTGLSVISEAMWESRKRRLSLSILLGQASRHVATLSEEQVIELSGILKRFGFS